MAPFLGASAETATSNRISSYSSLSPSTVTNVSNASTVVSASSRATVIASSATTTATCDAPDVTTDGTGDACCHFGGSSNNSDSGHSTASSPSEPIYINTPYGTNEELVLGDTRIRFGPDGIRIRTPGRLPGAPAYSITVRGALASPLAAYRDWCDAQLAAVPKLRDPARADEWAYQLRVVAEYYACAPFLFPPDVPSPAPARDGDGGGDDDGDGGGAEAADDPSRAPTTAKWRMPPKPREPGPLQDIWDERYQAARRIVRESVAPEVWACMRAGAGARHRKLRTGPAMIAAAVEACRWARGEERGEGVGLLRGADEDAAEADLLSRGWLAALHREMAVARDRPGAYSSPEAAAEAERWLARVYAERVANKGVVAAAAPPPPPPPPPEHKNGASPWRTASPARQPVETQGTSALGEASVRGGIAAQPATSDAAAPAPILGRSGPRTTPSPTTVPAKKRRLAKWPHLRQDRRKDGSPAKTPHDKDKAARAKHGDDGAALFVKPPLFAHPYFRHNAKDAGAHPQTLPATAAATTTGNSANGASTFSFLGPAAVAAVRPQSHPTGPALLDPEHLIRVLEDLKQSPTRHDRDGADNEDSPPPLVALESGSGAETPRATTTTSAAAAATTNTDHSRPVETPDRHRHPQVELDFEPDPEVVRGERDGSFTRGWRERFGSVRQGKGRVLVEVAATAPPQRARITSKSTDTLAQSLCEVASVIE